MYRKIDRLQASLNVDRRVIVISLIILILGVMSHFLFTLQPFFMDEKPIIRNHLVFVHDRTLVPDHAKYPTFFYYLSFPATIGTVVYEHLFGVGESITQTASRLYLLEKRDLAMGARLFNVAAFYISCVIISAIIWRYISRISALLVFLLITSAPGMLQYSAYALPDITLILLSAACLWLLYKVEHPDKLRKFFLAVVCIGLATSTKYNAASLLIPALVWGVVVFQRAGEMFSRRFFLAFGLSVAILIISFLAGSPGWILDTEFFLAELRFELEHAAKGHLGAAGIPVIGQFELLLKSLPFLFILSVPGFFIAWREAPMMSLLPISLICGTLALSAMSSKQSFHYMFPAIPGFVILAGYTISAITKRFRHTGTAMVVIAAFVSVFNSSHLAVQYLRPNTTALAKAWIVEHIAEGSPIAVSWAYVPRLFSEDTLEELRQSNTYNAIKDDPLASEPTFNVLRYDYNFAQLKSSDAEYLVTSSSVFSRFFEFGIFTRVKPSQSDPLFEDFLARREFYNQLFESSDWKIVFDTNTGNGPRTFVFQRIRKES